MPSSAPAAPPCARRRSAAAASSRARGLSTGIELSCTPFVSLFFFIVDAASVIQSFLGSVTVRHEHAHRTRAQGNVRPQIPLESRERAAVDGSEIWMLAREIVHEQ